MNTSDKANMDDLRLTYKSFDFNDVTLNNIYGDRQSILDAEEYAEEKSLKATSDCCVSYHCWTMAEYFQSDCIISAPYIT